MNTSLDIRAKQSKLHITTISQPLFYRLDNNSDSENTKRHKENVDQESGILNVINHQLGN